MRSPINAPILATACVIGLGIFAQSVSTGEPYEGPLVKMWNAAFQSDPLDTVARPSFDLHGPQNDEAGHWL